MAKQKLVHFHLLVGVVCAFGAIFFSGTVVFCYRDTAKLFGTANPIVLYYLNVYKCNYFLFKNYYPLPEKNKKKEEKKTLYQVMFVGELGTPGHAFAVLFAEENGKKLAPIALNIAPRNINYSVLLQEVDAEVGGKKALGQRKPGSCILLKTITKDQYDKGVELIKNWDVLVKQKEMKYSWGSVNCVFLTYQMALIMDIKTPSAAIAFYLPWWYMRGMILMNFENAKDYFLNY